jgi:hypothetical protein
VTAGCVCSLVLVMTGKYFGVGKRFFKLDAKGCSKAYLSVYVGICLILKVYD